MTEYCRLFYERGINMPVFRISENEISFPDPTLARDDGLLAIGGDLCVERLLLAYTHGIFPWYDPGRRSCGGAPKSALSFFRVRSISPAP